LRCNNCLDEITAALCAALIRNRRLSQAHAGIPSSQFVVLPGCSHIAQAERPDLTPGLVRGWLTGVEASLLG
jgi:hypothetical protein